MKSQNMQGKHPGWHLAKGRRLNHTELASPISFLCPKGAACLEFCNHLRSNSPFPFAFLQLHRAGGGLGERGTKALSFPAVAAQTATSLLLPLRLHFLIFFFFLFFRAAPAAYGGSQTRGQRAAVPPSLHHSSTRSEPRLQPTPLLTATLDP